MPGCAIEALIQQHAQGETKSMEVSHGKPFRCDQCGQAGRVYVEDSHMRVRLTGNDVMEPSKCQKSNLAAGIKISVDSTTIFS